MKEEEKRKGLRRKTPLRPISKKRQAQGKKPFRQPTLEEVKERFSVVTAAMLGEKPKLNKKPVGERSRLIEQVDTVYAKLRKAQAEHACTYAGHITCFICGDTIPVEESELMHCEPRVSMGTRYDDINAQPGCHSCNSKPNGDREEFRRMLDVTFGPNTAERNEIKSKTVERMGSEYLRYLLEKFKGELKKLK